MENHEFDQITSGIMCCQNLPNAGIWTAETQWVQAQTELADGVKVEKENQAEQEISLESQKRKMEMDDLWLKVHQKVNDGLDCMKM